jgi:Pro-kumamolisin, activation domain
MAIPAGFRPIPGSERPQVPGSTLDGPVDAAEQVMITLLLRQKPGSPELPDLQYWQDTSPDKRSFLSPEELSERHGSDPAEVDAVVDYLTSKNLRVLDKHAGAGRIVAEGAAADMNAAFGVRLNNYRAPRQILPHHNRARRGQHAGDSVHIGEQVHRGFEGPVHVPTKLSEIVVTIIGLDNRRLGARAGTGTGDPPGAQYLSPVTIAQNYNFPTNTAIGQTIGIFEAADESAAYLHSDVISFIQSLPGGAALPLPNFNDIGLLGQSNNPALVSAANDSAWECTTDVAIAATTGLGCNVNVYFTTDTELGWDHFLHRAMFPHAGESPPSVLTASWLPYFSDDVGTIGPRTATGSPAYHLNRHLQRAAARGITVLMAIGDWGANNRVGGTLCHVSYPNANPWVTACGGTIMGDANSSPPPLFDEWAWSDANVASQFDLAPFDATGGGVSAQFPRPPYQVASGVLPISKNDGAVRRGVPDVAGMVAMNGFFIAGVGGPGENDWIGTSAVSPFYAGLMATINAFLGRNVGFLNPTLYRYGPEICNDIRVGNNDSGLLPDAPFYTTDVGWDPCTGWGSINGLRLLAACAPAPIIVTSIADSGNLGDACVGSFVDEILTINNSGFSTLLIWKITAAPADFEVPGVTSYPLAVSPGGSLDLTVRFKPGAIGLSAGTITIFSNDLFSPQTVNVSGTGVGPRLVVGIADHGNFGNVCVGSFADEPLVVNNGGKCTLLITDVTSSSPEFLVPAVVAYPIAVAGGTSVSLPIRFQPTVLGATPPGAAITVHSNVGNRTVHVSGNAPAGKLEVTGSTFFGGVPACCREERTISICNVGDCKLHVSSVAFKRKNRHWKLINNPFPATLHPGSCLAVVIRYKATEKFPRACELVITSDDPTTPVKVLDVVAGTVWNECGCKQCCDDCRKGRCEQRHCDPCCCKRCNDDCDDEEHADDDC